MSESWLAPKPHCSCSQPLATIVLKSAIRYRKSISFTSTRDIELVNRELLEITKAKLEKLKPSSLKQNGNILIYTGGILRFVWNWNLLNPISEGLIQIESQKNKLIVKYEIQFVEIFVISIFTAILACFIVDNIFAKLIVPLASIFWIFGMPVGITIYRYNRFIKRIISKQVEEDTPQLSIEQEQWISDPTKCDACGHHIEQTDMFCPDCGITLD